MRVYLRSVCLTRDMCMYASQLTPKPQTRRYGTISPSFGCWSASSSSSSSAASSTDSLMEKGRGGGGKQDKMVATTTEAGGCVVLAGWFDQ